MRSGELCLARASRRCTQANCSCARASRDCAWANRNRAPVEVGLGWIRTTSPTEVDLEKIVIVSYRGWPQARRDWLGRVVTAPGESWLPRARRDCLRRVVASGGLWPRMSRGLGRVVVRCARRLKASRVGSAIEGNISHTEGNWDLLHNGRSNG
jgi:hypothetical protein